MRVLLLHARYRVTGGEEAYVDGLAALLRGRGHAVLRVERANADLGRWSAARALLAQPPDAALLEAAREFRPDVVHVNNLYPAPGARAVADLGACGIPVVQTLHNYRLVCPSGTFLASGLPCERCTGSRSTWPAVRHRCLGGAGQSVVYALAIARDRRRRTLLDGVARFVCPSRFLRDKLVGHGLDAAKTVVLPSPVEPLALPEEPGETVLYAGRLSAEKGVALLPALARALPGTRFEVAGQGPLAPVLSAEAARLGNLRLLGWLDRAQLAAALGRAALVLAPSLCYEGFPLAVAEALVSGRAVLGSRIGAIADLVRPGETGALAPPGDVVAWGTALRELLADRAALGRMGRAARRLAPALAPAAYHERIVAVYEEARRACSPSLVAPLELRVDGKNQD